jgi:hypothetical protein
MWTNRNSPEKVRTGMHHLQQRQGCNELQREEHLRRMYERTEKESVE